MTTQTDYSSTEQQDPPKISSTLNVLTILTFIGCSIFLIFTIMTPWFLNFSTKMIDKAVQGELTPEKMAAMRKAKENIELTQHNLVPLIVLGIAGIVLCFVGALMMRKLKKDGFWIYVAGQIVPLLGSLFIVGTSQYQGISSFFLPAIQIVFIVLYSMQRKNLVY
jgi:hypothetical protein